MFATLETSIFWASSSCSSSMHKKHGEVLKEYTSLGVVSAIRMRNKALCDGMCLRRSESPSISRTKHETFDVSSAPEKSGVPNKVMLDVPTSGNRHSDRAHPSSHSGLRPTISHFR